MDSGLYCFFKSSWATNPAIRTSNHTHSMCSNIGSLVSMDSQHYYDYFTSSLPFVNGFTCNAVNDPELVLLRTPEPLCEGTWDTLLTYFWTSGSDLKYEGNFTWNSGGEPYLINKGYISFLNKALPLLHKTYIDYP